MRKKNAIFVISFTLFIFSIAALTLSILSADFAAFFNSQISSRIKGFMLAISNSVEFSVIEFFAVLLPAVIFLIAYLFRVRNVAKLKQSFLSLLGIFLLCLSLFINTNLIGHFVEIGYEKSEFEDEQLISAAKILVEKINSIKSVSYPDKEELAEKLYSAYQSLSFSSLSLTDIKPKIKAFKHSSLAARLGILGNYSFLTSEISVNFSAPEYTVPFTAAHEMAHLFGISHEADAGFFAYLVSIETKDEAFLYSAYLSAFEFLGRELSKRNFESYKEIYKSLSEMARGDLVAYRNFYSEKDGKIRDNADKINNTLTSFTDKSGDKHYDGVTKYLVIFILSGN